MKLTIISLISLSLGFLLAFSALKTAEQIARISLVKTETVSETN